MDIGLRLLGAVDAREAVTRGRDALDRALDFDAELTLAVARDDAWVLGAMQRADGAPASSPLVQRVSGGALVRMGPGTVHLVLALSRTSAFYPCDAARLMNRYVRPLLRALTRSGATAAYFGRDWVSVMHRPAAAIGFAHDAGTGRAALEAFVSVRTPLSAARASFLGKEPGTLEEITGRAFDSEAIVRAIAESYASAAGGALREIPVGPSPSMVDEALLLEPAWASRVDEVIGPVCAGPDRAGRMRLGGDFMASRDAVARIEASVSTLSADATRESLEGLVREAFAVDGATFFGIRDMESVVRALWDARGRGLR